MSASAKPQALKDAFLLPIGQIRPSSLNPRKEFDQGDLLELALSIREHGVLEPLIVRKSSDGYELVAGERRLRAAEIAKLDKLPVRIVELEDGPAAEVRLIENLQRKDLAPIEEAKGISEIMLRHGLTQEQVGKRIGKSDPWVRSRLRLLEIPENLQKFIAEGKLPLGSVNEIAPLAKYPVIKAVTGALMERIGDDNGRAVPSSEIHHLIENVLDSQYMQADYLDDDQDPDDFLAVDITDYNLDVVNADHLCPHFDWTQCKECKDVHRQFDEDTKEELSAICLLPECFGKKLEEANIKFRQFQAAEAERLGVRPSDPNQKLLGVDYEFTRLYSWNTHPDCAVCDKKVTDERNNVKCLDPKCNAKLEKEKKAKDLKASKDAWSKFMDALNRKTLPRLGGTLTSMDAAMKRRLLKVLSADWETKEALDKTLKVFKVDAKNLSSLSDEDIDAELARVMLYLMAKDASRGSIPTPSNIEEALAPQVQNMEAVEGDHGSEEEVEEAG